MSAIVDSDQFVVGEGELHQEGGLFSKSGWNLWSGEVDAGEMSINFDSSGVSVFDVSCLLSIKGDISSTSNEVVLDNDIDCNKIVVHPNLWDKLTKMDIDDDTLGKDQIKYTGNLTEEEIREREQSKKVIKY